MYADGGEKELILRGRGGGGNSKSFQGSTELRSSFLRGRYGSGIKGAGKRMETGTRWVIVGGRHKIPSLSQSGGRKRKTTNGGGKKKQSEK